MTSVLIQDSAFARERPRPERQEAPAASEIGERRNCLHQDASLPCFLLPYMTAGSVRLVLDQAAAAVRRSAAELRRTMRVAGLARCWGCPLGSLSAGAGSQRQSPRRRGSGADAADRRAVHGVAF